MTPLVPTIYFGYFKYCLEYNTVKFVNTIPINEMKDQ